MTTAARMGLGKWIARRGLMLAALFVGCIATDRGGRVASPDLANVTAPTTQVADQGDDAQSTQPTGWLNLTNQTKAAGVTGLTFAVLMAYLHRLNHKEKMAMITRVNQEPDGGGGTRR